MVLGAPRVRPAFDQMRNERDTGHMRTNIDINDKLMAEALRASGKPTKRAVVEEALKLLVQLKRQEGIRSLRGKVQWDGDLEKSRASRVFE